jgi:hypothetical protein
LRVLLVAHCDSADIELGPLVVPMHDINSVEMVALLLLVPCESALGHRRDTRFHVRTLRALPRAERWHGRMVARTVRG